MNAINKIFNSRFWSLALKEIQQILRDRQLIVFLIFPPTIQLLLYGFVLNPDVQNLKLGIVDYAQTYESRELISALTENRIFIAERYLFNEEDLSVRVREGNLTVGLIIPPDFQRQLERGSTAEVQVFIDGVDANTAGIASGYINQIIEKYNLRLATDRAKLLINLQSVFLYNPGLSGSLILLFFLSSIYLFVGMSIGIMLATISRTQQQAFLTSFFINLPVVQLSGAIAPIESMPIFFQYLSLLNPLRHYVAIVRGILLRGVGLETLWGEAIALVLFAAIMLSISVSRFRRQLI
jgi:ABC-2 type transport system permease protein